MQDTPLQSAYLNAIYSITLGEQIIDLTFVRHRFPSRTIPPPTLAPTWAFITARNPMSVQLDEPANRLRDESLDRAITVTGRAGLPASARAPSGDWSEPGRILLACTRLEALTLAHTFNQRAIIWADANRIGILDPRTESWTIRPITRS